MKELWLDSVCFPRSLFNVSWKLTHAFLYENIYVLCNSCVLNEFNYHFFSRKWTFLFGDGGQFTTYDKMDHYFGFIYSCRIFLLVHRKLIFFFFLSFFFYKVFFISKLSTYICLKDTKSGFSSTLNFHGKLNIHYYKYRYKSSTIIRIL